MPVCRTLISPRHGQPWTRFGSLLIGFAGISLLLTAFGAHLYSVSLSSALLSFVLISLGIAIGLQTRFLLLAREEHRTTVKALVGAAEREYKSVFDSALDGILIVDDQGLCVDVNPAMLALLQTDRKRLVGRSVEKLFRDDSRISSSKRFLECECGHGEARVVGSDGGQRLVEYTAGANFASGRHVMVIRDVTQRKQAEAALHESEERFQQIANNIQEIFWMLDAKDLKTLYVNPAYETITGRSRQLLVENPHSYEDALHPEDRVRVLSLLVRSLETGRFDEEFRIVRPDRTIRWIWARGFPVRDSSGIARRLVGTAQDVTARKDAEEQLKRNLQIAEAARAEVEAFRRTSLALTQDLSMNYVLDTLLQSLLVLVPCESAQVILVEAGTRLFLAREVLSCEADHRLPPSLIILDARESSFLMEILTRKESTLISDTAQEERWAAFNGFSHFQSWLCVPLVASQQVLGLLSLGDRKTQRFTDEHLRLAKSLAIPAAVAIQNARLYEQAEIFRAEIEQSLAAFHQGDVAFESGRRGRRPS